VDVPSLSKSRESEIIQRAVAGRFRERLSGRVPAFPEAFKDTTMVVIPTGIRRVQKYRVQKPSHLKTQPAI
jgi:hypothetical protein